jgi:hypothetical protein
MISHKPQLIWGTVTRSSRCQMDPAQDMPQRARLNYDACKPKVEDDARGLRCSESASRQKGPLRRQA